jgi:DNA-directed RNA polymerase specialized sigma subunit
MDKKRYLRRGYRINLEIESKKEVLDELKANLDGIKAIQLSEKVQGGDIPSDNAMFNRINKVIEEEKKLENLYDFMSDLSKEIDKIEDVVERALLRYRYFLGLTWEEIAEKLGYSIAQVYRLHIKACKNFNKINDSK